MPKIYNQKTIDLLQNEIDGGRFQIERQEYGFATKLYIAGIRIELTENKMTGMREQVLNVLNGKTNNEYLKIWKTFAPGHFFGKDYRKNLRDSDGNCPYFILRATLNGVPVRAIVRELFEDDRSQKIKFRDLTAEGKDFTIIKICRENPDDDSWLIGKTDVGDIMHATELDCVDGI